MGFGAKEIYELSDRNLVKQSHDLNMANYHLGTLAMDILYLFLTEISNEDSDFNIYVVSFSDLERKMGKKIDRRNIKKALYELRKSEIEIIEGEDYFYSSWFSAISYSCSLNLYSFEISSMLKSRLINLKDNQLFSLTDFNQLVRIRSSYGKRIFSILSQFEDYNGNGWYKISVDRLKEILNVKNKYKTYSNFKRKVITVSINQINKYTDMKIEELIEIKKGRSVSMLHFKFNKKAKAKNSKTNNNDTINNSDTNNNDKSMINNWLSNKRESLDIEDIINVEVM